MNSIYSMIHQSGEVFGNSLTLGEVMKQVPYRGRKVNCQEKGAKNPKNMINIQSLLISPTKKEESLEELGWVLV